MYDTEFIVHKLKWKQKNKEPVGLQLVEPCNPQ